MSTQRRFFSKLLDFPIRVTNPYLYKTKAEVVRKLVAEHEGAVKLSASCWRGSRLSKDYNHCGACVPCLIRRISIEHHGLILAEYERDLLSENVGALPATDEGKKNAVELIEFAHTFNSLNETDIGFNYPDLFSENIDFVEAVAMYRKFAAEATGVLAHYPGTLSLLPPKTQSPEKSPPKNKAPRQKGSSAKKASSRKGKK